MEVERECKSNNLIKEALKYYIQVPNNGLQLSKMPLGSCMRDASKVQKVPELRFLPSGTFGLGSVFLQKVPELRFLPSGTFPLISSLQKVPELQFLTSGTFGQLSTPFPCLVTLIPGHPKYALRLLSMTFQAHLRVTPGLWALDTFGRYPWRRKSPYSHI